MRKALDVLRELSYEITGVLATIEDPKALAYLGDKVLTGKRSSLPLRLAAARALGGGAGDKILHSLAKDLSRAKDMDMKIAILKVAEQLGRDAEPLIEPALDALGDKEPPVREAAAMALAYMGVGAAIGPMIELLAETDGQAQLRVAGALEKLTGEEFGTTVGTWRAWFKAEGEGLAADQARLGGGMFRMPRREQTGDYYFGLPMDGRSIVYIIDASGSMDAEIEWPEESGEMVTRLAACQDELVKALALLTPKQHFNVIWYNDGIHEFSQKMEKVTPRKVKEAQDWVKVLKPASSTNIHDAVQSARPAAAHSLRLSPETAGMLESLGRLSPRASIADAIVLAVYIPPQLPGPGIDVDSITFSSRSPIFFAACWPIASKMLMISTSLPSSEPGRIVPP